MVSEVKKYWRKISAGFVLLMLTWLLTFGVINFETYFKTVGVISTAILIFKNV